MKIKFVLESQRSPGRYRLELEVASLAELRDALKLFESLSLGEASDQYLKELSDLSQKTIRAWMEGSLKKEAKE